ncbi:hypothetical protein ACFFNY_21885 [Paenibacillus hodogayensis]|uniref:Uncharacterized protein n=2 Tax=Paenibacillus hodogayensis TaxID=279208 RepID=A0ABV5W0Y7_9BACL
MRAAIKARLAAELTALSGRCYDAYEPTGTTAKPFATVNLAGLARGADWLGLRHQYDVSLYGAKDEAAALDELAGRAVKALNGIRLSPGGGGAAFTCRFDGMPEPARLDTTLDAIEYRLVFEVSAVGAEAVTLSEDCLNALCDWSALVAGPDWTVYRQHWPQDYASPAILWRLEQAEASSRGAAGTDLSQKTVGHVVGRTEAEQISMVRSLTAALGGSVRIQVEPVANQYAAVGPVAATYTADALTVGQLNVALRQIVPVAQSAGPTIAQVHYEGGTG